MKKITICLCIFLIIILLGVNSYAKYVIENTSLVANINIDGEPPKIELLRISNTNEKYNNYANKTHTITVNFRVKEKNVKESNIFDNIKLLLNDKEIKAGSLVIEEIKSGEYINYEAFITKVNGNGKLKILIPEASVIDMAGQVNEKFVIDTGIIIDNIAPVVNFTQEEIADGKINAKIIANEKIREVNAWNLSENDTTLNKEFACNVLYPFQVTDLAGNSTTIDVKVDKATNIQIKYSAGNYNISGFQTSEEVNEIVGTKALAKNNKYRVEGIALWWQGLDEDFIGVNCYDYTNWGEGKQGLCNYSETRYTYGYNPGENKFSTLENSVLTRVNGYAGVYLGGLNVNFVGYRGMNNGEPVPEKNKEQQLFGISALNIRLKDYSYYSIVYQVWVEGQGWLEPVSDGVETTLAYDKPIGAYRMSLIPKTEKQYLIDSWKKDVGTNNMK